MRRGVGLGAHQKRQAQEAKFAEKASEMAHAQIASLTKQMDVFRGNLQEFAAKHKKDIVKNPAFRRQFQEMCATVGVDPLQSSGNFWTKLLGVGDFYFQLGVQIVEVCLATQHMNGGLMRIEEVHRRLVASRYSANQQSSSSSTGSSRDNEIAMDDVMRALQKLSVLGGGIKLIPSGKSFIVQSVAAELSMDQTAIAQLALTSGGHVDEDQLVSEMGWTRERSVKAVCDLLMEGIVWLDEQPPTGRRWIWFAGLS